MANFLAMQGLWHAKAPHILPNVSVFVPKQDGVARAPNAKVPSAFAANGSAYNMRGWTEREATPFDLTAWGADARLGFGVRCAYVRAIDIDIDAAQLVSQVFVVCNEEARKLQRASKNSAKTFAIRRRTGSARCVLLYRAATFNSAPQPKICVKLEQGCVEFLGDSQYVAIEGSRFSATGALESRYFFQSIGEHYNAGLCEPREPEVFPTLDDLPELSHADVSRIIRALQEWLCATFGAQHTAHEELAAGTFSQKFRCDELTELGKAQVKSLQDQGLVISSGGPKSSQWFVKCPWQHTHTAASGDKDAMFLPERIVGGALYGAGFKCLHAHCSSKNIVDFASAVGITCHLPTQFKPPEQVVLDGRGVAIEDCVTPSMLVELNPSLTLSSAAEIISVFASPKVGTRSVFRARLDENNPLAYRSRTLNEQAAHRLAAPEARTKVFNKTRPSMVQLVAAMRDLHTFGYVVSFDTFLQNVKVRKFDDVSPWSLFADKHVALFKMALNDAGFIDPGTTVLREAITLVAESNTSDCAVDWLSSLVWDGVPRFSEFVTKGWNLEATPYNIAVASFVWTALAGRLVSPGVKVDMIPIFVGAQGSRKTTFVQNIPPFKSWFAATSLDVHDADIARKTLGKCVLELPELHGLKTRAIESIKAWVTTQEDQWVPKYKEAAYTAPRRWVAFGTGNDMRLFVDPTGNRRWLPIDMSYVKVLNTDWLQQNRDQLWAEGFVKFRESGVDYAGVSGIADAQRAKFKPRDVWAVPIKKFYDTIGRMPTVNEVFEVCLSVPLAYANAAQVARAEQVLASLEADELGVSSSVQRSYVTEVAPAAQKLSFNDFDF